MGLFEKFGEKFKLTLLIIKLMVYVVVITLAFGWSYILGIIIICVLILYPNVKSIIKSKEYISSKLLFKRFKVIIKSFFVVGIILLLFKVSALFGMFATIVLMFLLILFRVFKNREFFIKGMRNIETQIYGKSLDKENWDYKGQWREKKIKFKWMNKGVKKK